MSKHVNQTSNASIIVSQGSGICHEIIELIKKENLGWNIIDSREAFEDDGFFYKCRRLELKTFPILAINGNPIKYAADPDSAQRSFDWMKKIVKRETFSLNF